MFLSISVNRIDKSKVVHICSECKSPVDIGGSYFRVSNFAGVKRYGRNGGTIPTTMVLCSECYPVFDRMINRLGSWKHWR